MEQKTEASQAVTSKALTEDQMIRLLACIATGEVFDIVSKADADAIRAALKAQPAPTIAANPVKYEQRFVSPQGIAAVWHDAQAETFHRHRSNGDLGDGWLHEVRALYAGPPAPTEAAQGALSANPNLTTSALTCQRVAAQGNTTNNSSSSQLSGNTGELAQGWDVDDLISDMDINEEVAGMRAELQASSTIIPSILAAQGEDSARLVADREISYELMQDDMVVAGTSGPGAERDIAHYAMVYSQDGPVEVYRVIRQQVIIARASAETGGVKS